MFQTGEKLASKLKHVPLDIAYRKCDEENSSTASGNVCSSRKSCLRKCNVPQVNGVCVWSKKALQSARNKLGLFRYSMQRQTFYAHCLKLLSLFVIALVHLIYMHPFLEMFSTLDDYAAVINSKVQIEPKQAAHAHEANVLKHQMDTLTDYKKNMWMSVATMCVALSTSCFFLFLLPTTKIRRFHVALVGITDVIAFATLPALLVRRAELVDNLHQYLPEALRNAHKLVSAERLMNAAQCTIHPREKLPFCSQIILKSIIPVLLLKYLLILCILTLVYLLVAYFIDWCLRHWFPHQQNCCDSCYCGCTGEKNFCDCSECCSSNNTYDAFHVSQNMWKVKQRDHNNKTYLPAMLLPHTSSQPSLSLYAEQLRNTTLNGYDIPVLPGRRQLTAYALPPQIPNPLLGNVELPPTQEPRRYSLSNSYVPEPVIITTVNEQKPAEPEEEEPIPAEPVPNNLNNN
jgi:hypothetical protein